MERIPGGEVQRDQSGVDQLTRLLKGPFRRGPDGEEVVVVGQRLETVVLRGVREDQGAALKDAEAFRWAKGQRVRDGAGLRGSAFDLSRYRAMS